jgi:hypothetical protein
MTTISIPPSRFIGIGAGWAEPTRGTVTVLRGRFTNPDPPDRPHVRRDPGGWPLHRRLPRPARPVYDPEAISMTPIPGWTAGR